MVFYESAASRRRGTFLTPRSKDDPAHLAALVVFEKSTKKPHLQEMRRILSFVNKILEFELITQCDLEYAVLGINKIVCLSHTDVIASIKNNVVVLVRQTYRDREVE